MHFVSVQVLVDDYKRGLENVFQDTFVRSLETYTHSKTSFAKRMLPKFLPKSLTTLHSSLLLTL